MEEVNMEGAEVVAVFLVCVFVYMVVDTMDLFSSGVDAFYYC